MDDLALRAANFSDWRILLGRPEATIVHRPEPAQLDDDLIPFADRLGRAILMVDPGDYYPFSVECEGLRFRAQQNAPKRYALRLMKTAVWELKDLKMPPEITGALMQRQWKELGGLILISGPTGSGKTTTAGTVVASRLQMFGGYALTVEDPPEEPLEGWHGQGYCEQMTVHKGDFTEALVRSLRCFPSKSRSILYFGEVRTAHAAGELLRIAVDGHLVVSTIHANDITSGLQRLLNLAREDVGDKDARYLLGNSLRLVLHQQFIAGKQLRTTPLWVTDTVRAKLREDPGLNLGDDILATQKRLAEQYAATERRPAYSSPSP